MAVYYNENEPFAAAWLRELIKRGLIADGEVDERSIVDVDPADLRGFQQCHFFAGIGGWSVALRLAGWSDDRPVWTGSCPCQPFSAAGAGKAANDERHLWPAWFSLIAERRPAIVFGEQVEAAIGWGWLDAVFADLEGQGYACGASVLPACGVGAPHIRQRCWFVADASRAGSGRNAGTIPSSQGQGQGQWLGTRHVANEPIADGAVGFLADADGRHASAEGLQRSREHGQRPEDGRPGGGVAHSERDGWGEGREDSLRRAEGIEPQGARIGLANDSRRSVADSERDGRRTDEPQRQAQGRIADGWSGAEWLQCVDGKARPVEPGTFPLAHGVQRRTSKLRAYGNAIVPQLAATFIEACEGLIA